MCLSKHVSFVDIHTALFGSGVESGTKRAPKVGLFCQEHYGNVCVYICVSLETCFFLDIHTALFGADVEGGSKRALTGRLCCQEYYGTVCVCICVSL